MDILNPLYGHLKCRILQNQMHSYILSGANIRFWWRDDDVIDATEETDSETS